MYSPLEDDLRSHKVFIAIGQKAKLNEDRSRQQWNKISVFTTQDAHGSCIEVMNQLSQYV
jgi:hypothetical protein